MSEERTINKQIMVGPVRLGAHLWRDAMSFGVVMSKSLLRVNLGPIDVGMSIPSRISNYRPLWGKYLKRGSWKCTSWLHFGICGLHVWWDHRSSLFHAHVLFLQIQVEKAAA